MCGISGAFNFSGDASRPNTQVVSRLNDIQRQRGPDGAGLWVSAGGSVVFGHRRLAIIDTSASGAQPMTDVTGRFTITFNGEIYNYREIRRALEKRGRRFATESDTEVLINAVAEWGDAAFPRLRGMYAFALWDATLDELWIARDPYGIKPLYLAVETGTLWFASQARALAAVLPSVGRRDPAGLMGFYLWGHVPEPFTWWAGVRGLSAGHLLRLKRGSSIGEPRPFARIEDCYAARRTTSEDPSVPRDAIAEAVRYHTVADVPIGVFLSSGIDSSVITALAVESGAKLKTITVGFDEFRGTPYDETSLAEEIARRLGTDHATINISRSTFDELLDDFFAAMDQPTIDGLNTYLVSWAAASQGLKVALSGVGGDELFGGYPSFQEIPQLVRWGRYLPARKFSAAVLHLLQRTVLRRTSPKLRKLIELNHDVPSAYILRRGLFLEAELEDLVDESVVEEGLHVLSSHASVRQSIRHLIEQGAPMHGQIAALESIWYMRNQLLRDTDWSSMHFGLEVRVPFVDYALLQRLGPMIASSRPPQKSDLFECARDVLPAQLRERRKTGFVTPVYRWAAEGRYRGGNGRAWACQVHRRFRIDDGRRAGPAGAAA